MLVLAMARTGIIGMLPTGLGGGLIDLLLSRNLAGGTRFVGNLGT